MVPRNDVAALTGSLACILVCASSIGACGSGDTPSANGGTTVASSASGAGGSSVSGSGSGGKPTSSSSGAGAGGGAPVGDLWYVSTAGNNADGKTWATAWKELDQIDWSVVMPSDHIEIDQGTYSARLEPKRGGTAEGRITIERSTAPGHDGKVTFDFTNTMVPDYWAGMVRIKEPYLTIDGKDNTKFEWITDSSCLVVLDNQKDDDFFALENVKLGGHASPDNGGAALCIFSGSMSMDRVWFGTQVGAEDHIKFVTSSNSSLKIEHSVFTPWISINGSHSDLIEQCWPGCMAGDLTFKYNLVWDSGPGGGNIVFTLDPHWANVDVSYNVFKDTYEVFQFSSRGAERISNNVFYDVFSTFGGDDTWEAVNNVFVAPPDNSSIVYGSLPKYSLWGPGTYGYSAAGMNLMGDPKFVDPTNVLGADGVPFTADDGFNLGAGSPAIDKGTMTADSLDIRGNPIVKKPDIGAYEHP